MYTPQLDKKDATLLGCLIDNFYTLCYTAQEIDGEAFMELTEEDIHKLTDKMGLIKKILWLIKMVISFCC